MKFYLFRLVFILLPLTGHTQECDRLKDSIYQKHNVKSVYTTVVIQDSDTLEAMEIQYNWRRQLLSEKFLYLEDVMLYAHAYSYEYKRGKLTKKIDVQTDYPRDAEDSSLLDGYYLPSIRKWTYQYGLNGNLKTEKEYLKFRRDDYRYERKGSYSYDSKNENFTITYTSIINPTMTYMDNRVEKYYFNEKKLLKQMYLYWTTMNYSVDQKFTYDSKDRLTYESRTDNDSNLRSTKFTYENDLLLKVEKFNFYKKNESTIHQYEYNEKGQKIKETVQNSINDHYKTFEYYENGLLKCEIWFSPAGKKKYTFTTTYEFY